MPVWLRLLKVWLHLRMLQLDLSTLGLTEHPVFLKLLLNINFPYFCDQISNRKQLKRIKGCVGSQFEEIQSLTERKTWSLGAAW